MATRYQTLSVPVYSKPPANEQEGVSQSNEPAPNMFAPKSSLASGLADQILAQGTSSGWTGEGWGSAVNNATAMGDILAGIGITDIRQFGKLDDGRFGNRVTGQAVENTYGDRQTGDAFGGTYAGSGNTGFRVQFADNGNPVFYTSGQSSNTLANILGNSKILNLAANIGAAYFGGPLGSAALQVAKGGDLGDAAKAALMTYGGQQLSGALKGAMDGGAVADTGNIFSDSTSGDFSAVPTDTSSFFDTPAGVVVGDPMSPGYSMDSVVSLPPLDIPVPYAAPPVSGLDQYAFEPSYSLSSNVPSVNEGFQAPAVNTSVEATFGDLGDFVPSYNIAPAVPAITEGFQAPVINTPMADVGSLADYSFPEVFNEGFQLPPSLPTSAMPVGVPDPVAFEPSYSLAPDVPTVNEGFQAPSLDTEIWDGSSPVDYSFPEPFSEGLQILSSPSLPSMGGGQGLTTPVEGGTVGSLGFTPTGASPVLGDPASFINNPEITGQPVMATEAPPGMTAQQQSDLLKQVIKSFGSAGTAGLMGSAMSSPQQGQQPAYQPASTMPNYSPEYFQQVQQKYNQIAPAMPANVAAPLSQWYNQPSTGNGMMSSQPSIVQQGMFNRPAPPVPMGGSSLANLGTSLAGAAQPAYNPNTAPFQGGQDRQQQVMSEEQYNGQPMPAVLGYKRAPYADYLKDPTGEIGYKNGIANGTISQIGGTSGQNGQPPPMSEEQWNSMGHPMSAALGEQAPSYSNYLNGLNPTTTGQLGVAPGQIGGGLSGLIGGASPQIGGGLGGIQQQPLSEAEWNNTTRPGNFQMGVPDQTYSNYLNSFNQPAFQGTPYTPGLGGGLMGMLNRS
jgi:hypothetical protein